MQERVLKPLLVFAGLVVLAVLVRLVSETPNFHAVTAAALFAGFYFRHRATAVAVPLAIMVASDYLIGGYAKPVMLAVYASLLAPIAWRGLLRNRLNPLTVGLGAVTSSVVFYLLTNGAVWFAWYEPSWAGLLRCYGNALPFFVNALASDLLFSAGFFGAYALATMTSAAPVRASAAASV